VTILALVVIASLSAHALSAPLSSIGTIGHQFIGQPGLIAITTVGFVGSAIVAVSLIVYLKKSTFRLFDHIDEDRGFFYVIKDKKGKIKAYLGSSCHAMPKHWKGMNDQVKNIVDKCRKVIVECHGIPTEGGGLLGALGMQKGLDFKIIDYLGDNDSIELDQFETVQEEEKILKNFSKVIVDENVAYIQSNGCCSCAPKEQASMSLLEQFDRVVVTWQTGDEEAISNLMLTLTNGKGIDELGENTRNALKSLLDGRNRKWMPKILKELEKNNKKPFGIMPGAMHLFDYEELEVTGLITLIEEKGYTVERMEDGSEEETD
jgi:hypothetical protein